ncbi:beta-propeller domain-containing protein [Patescibacteria group bacterium]|nr:beta-propeller domain-containing protein [Patescibacteria group bacterium]
MNKEISTIWGILILLVVGSLTLLYFTLTSQPLTSDLVQLNNLINTKISDTSGTITNFTSEQDFKDYLEATPSYLSMFGGMDRVGGEVAASLLEESMGMGTADDSLQKTTTDSVDRVSETNVQVTGIDEPDIVKTDGKEIYFSSRYYYDYRWEGGIGLPEMILPPQETKNTFALKAFPPTNLAKDATIDKYGELLLKDNILIIFSGDKIYGYNVSNPKNPIEKWIVELDDRNQLIGTRMYQDKIYLITRMAINTPHPCPIEPLKIDGQSLTVSCVDIYHPSINIPVDVTYNVSVLDPREGKTSDNISFVGSANNSVIYMSENAIYSTYFYSGDLIKFIFNFTSLNQDIFPPWLIDKLSKLQTYDISDNAKFTELSSIMEKYYSSLDSDERLRIENELTNRMQDYSKKHFRELENTGIIKISVAGLKILANGSIPGKLLNQFSLDEYQNHLRIATTVGGNWFGIGIGNGTTESANDLYVLDENLKLTGAIKDLGLSERIYSARFIEDKGYLVTFRRIDPFYVLDLSNPQNPQLKGELKIPGYSSYLHPLAKNKILGIGEENNKVKISLFDVTSPANPIEISKYTLNEYWSEVSSTHHAFLQDAKHQVFFMPASQGGYIFSYQGNELKLQKAISDIVAKRALYINDYLYIVGEDKLVVLDETNWEKVNQLEY